MCCRSWHEGTSHYNKLIQALSALSMLEIPNFYEEVVKPEVDKHTDSPKVLEDVKTYSATTKALYETIANPIAS